MVVDEDRQMILIEGGSGLPDGGDSQVGTAKGEVRGGRRTLGGQASRGLRVEQAGRAIIGGLDDKCPHRGRSLINFNDC